LAHEVFNDQLLDRLMGNIGIGHVRYSDIEEVTAINAEPLVVGYKQGALALAYDGSLANLKGY